VGQLSGIHSVDAGAAKAPPALSLGVPKQTEADRGLVYSRPDTTFDHTGWTSIAIGSEDSSSPKALLTWYRANFDLPAPRQDVWVPWHLHLEAKGDGFIYINGHGIGRYFQAGPQNNFYIPECWLNFGIGQTNVVALSLRPLDKGVGVQALSIAPDAEFAEKR
jgi:hypothetical protein